MCLATAKSGETAAVLLIRQDIHREQQPTPGEHRDETVVAERTDETRERHRREMIEHRTPLQAQAAMGRQQGIARDLRSHLAIAQDEMGQDGEHRTTRGALDPPDGDSTQTDTHIMRVARQAPTAVTGRLVDELKAKRQHEGENTLEKRLPIAQQMKVPCGSPKFGGTSQI